MKKKLLSLLLSLTMCLGLLPGLASAAENDLPDWYFLFAIFKNVDADGVDKDGAATHVTYTMSQDEVDATRNSARQFEAYMNQLGVMHAHVDVVEIDAPLTELTVPDDGGSGISAAQAAPLLEEKVDLDRYDHVTCVISLNISTGYMGVTGATYENGTGHACIHLKNREYCLNHFSFTEADWPPSTYLHEFTHFTEYLSQKWGITSNLHNIQSEIYPELAQGGSESRRASYNDIFLNRVKGNAETGTGVAPVIWQYPPHVLRTMTELTIPSGVTAIGTAAFTRCTSLTEITIPSSVTSLGTWAFRTCTALTKATILADVTSIGGSTFQGCTNLASVSLPASITSVDNYAFVNCSSLTDVYFGGTEAQWKAIQIGDANGPLTRATIHYNSLMADVKTSDWFAQPVVWALENGVTNGTGGGRFSPDITCNQAQILTFLWRAKGEPKPSGAVSSTEFYASAVQWAKEQGLISGTFSPDAPCTRADVVTYLWKLAGSPKAGNANFSDVPASANYAQAVAWAVSKGVTNGTGNGQFSPDAACTRGQIVTFLYRALA